MRTAQLAILAAALLLAASTASGQQPQYVILRAPAAPFDHHHARHLNVPATPIQPVYRQSYAYGWFGAPPRRHWSRHFGYHRNFTQWSAR